MSGIDQEVILRQLERTAQQFHTYAKLIEPMIDNLDALERGGKLAMLAGGGMGAAIVSRAALAAIPGIGWLSAGTALVGLGTSGFARAEGEKIRQTLASIPESLRSISGVLAESLQSFPSALSYRASIQRFRQQMSAYQVASRFPEMTPEIRRAVANARLGLTLAFRLEGSRMLVREIDARIERIQNKVDQGKWKGLRKQLKKLNRSLLKGPTTCYSELTQLIDWPNAALQFHGAAKEARLLTRAFYEASALEEKNQMRLALAHSLDVLLRSLSLRAAAQYWRELKASADHELDPLLDVDRVRRRTRAWNRYILPSIWVLLPLLLLGWIITSFGWIAFVVAALAAGIVALVVLDV